MAAVQITGLRKLYGNVVALSDINITIKSGDFYTLLGPSGCGKTTLLRTIAGFHFQNAGHIAIDGQAVEQMPAYKRGVGMVFQDYAVFPHLSVFDNVAFGLRQRKLAAKEINERVHKVLDTVQLETLASRMPHELSGGQQQRVGLARAIVINPSVLLMDEPLSNLDAKLRVDLRAELRRIQQAMGMTTIYVTHDQEEALSMSDMVCVMHSGVILQAAPPLEIYRRPANRFVANFVGGNNFLRAEADGHRIVLSAAGAPGGVIGSYQNTGELGTAHGVVAAVRPEAIAVADKGTDTPEGTIAIPVHIDQISFVGREMEVAAITTSGGEALKAVLRPDERILSLEPGSEAVCMFAASDVSLFEDSETGLRLS